MESKAIKAVIDQVFDNPQVALPPVSYEITDKAGEEPYTSQYIDMTDVESYRDRLKATLLSRLTN